MEYSTGVRRDDYLGIQRMTVDGATGLFHSWDCGITLPVLRGGDGDGGSSGGSGGDGGSGSGSGSGSGGDGGQGNAGGDGGEGGKEGEGGKGDNKPDDEFDLDDLDSIKAIKDPRLRDTAKEAAKMRVRARTRTEERDAAIEERDELKGKVTDLEKKLKDGSGDTALKEKVTSLQSDVEKITAERDKLAKELGDSNKKLQTVAVGRQVRDAAKELKVQEGADFVQFVLEKNSLLSVDEDGDVENLPKHLKKLIKDGTLHVVSDDDEGGSGGGGGNASGSSSSGKSHNGAKGKSGGLDRVALEQKFPALRR